MVRNPPRKYTKDDMNVTEAWLRIIANQQIETNYLLQQFIDLYLEDNPRKEKPAHEKSGAL